MKMKKIDLLFYYFYCIKTNDNNECICSENERFTKI